MISINKATAKDVSLIVNIGKIAVEESHRGSCPAEYMLEFVEAHYNEAAIKNELTDPKNIYFVISYNGKPAGFSKIIFDFEHPNISQKNVTKLDRIYLLKEYFGLKLGFELLKFNIELCKKHKQSGIWLFTWIGNKRAINFYERTGFEIIGNHNFKITETHSNPNYQMYLDLKS